MKKPERVYSRSGFLYVRESAPPGDDFIPCSGALKQLYFPLGLKSAAGTQQRNRDVVYIGTGWTGKDQPVHPSQGVVGVVVL